MRVITVSREYGAGGGEVAGRLATLLGWELLDHELLHRAAQLEHLPDSELEAVDEQSVSLADRFRLHSPHQQYIHGLSEAARQAAAQGNVILVGRGSRQLVGESPAAFHLRLVAPRDWRVRRMAMIEDLSPEQVAGRCLHVDRTRERFTKYFFGPAASLPCRYDLVVNTGRVSIDEVVSLVAALVRNELGSHAVSDGGANLDAGSRAGGRRDRLRAHAGQPTRPSVLRPGTTRTRGRPAGRARGRGRENRREPCGNLRALPARQHPPSLLRDPGATHDRAGGAGRRALGRPRRQLLPARLSRCVSRAPGRAMGVRVRRVMEYRWLAEAPARKLIAESDDRRRRFYQDYFGTDWSDPLGYDMTVN